MTFQDRLAEIRGRVEAAEKEWMSHASGDDEVSWDARNWFDTYGLKKARVLLDALDTNERQFNDAIGLALQRAEAAEAECEKLRAALKIYGWHEQTCSLNNDGTECNCGFDTALAPRETTQ